MKLTAIVAVFGLIATAAANPIPDAEAPNLEGEPIPTTSSLPLFAPCVTQTDTSMSCSVRSCPAGVILESCLKYCSTSKCIACCNKSCATC